MPVSSVTAPVPRTAVVVLSVVACVVSVGSSARAGAILAKDEAIARAFPGATVETETVFLTEAQIAVVRERTGREPASKLFTYYEAHRDGHVAGWGVITTHVVRTLPEAFLVVLTPEKKIDRVLMLAFYEPPEYRPPDRWFEQFAGRHGEDGKGWRVGRDVDGLTGATLTSHAVTGAIREILAICEQVCGAETP